jgi:DNA topoisomerase-1
MTNLVIVESPAKCSKIQGFLGLGWKVIASLGHIRQLKEELEGGVGIEKDFEPSWIWLKEKSQAIAKIKEAAKSAEKIYLASDDDREGELIAYSVCLLLKLDPNTTPRAVFHEITEGAVKDAIENPRVIDMNKVNAAQARSVLDMMIGYTMSPLLWKSVGSGLSAGRCQTPALRLVVDRENEIRGFKCQSSWHIGGTWSVESGNRGNGWEAELVDELEDRDSAETYLEMCHDKPGGTVLKAENMDWSETAPLPLITSTLQQQASSLFHCGPKDTMRIAQKLYEAGHITYMRTDKAVLSEEAVDSAKEYVKGAFGAEYVSVGSGSKGSSSLSKKKGPKAQEAHEAIRPTHIDVPELPSTEDWYPRDKKLYNLIWLRTIQSVMTPAKGEKRIIHFIADGDEDGEFQWRASWKKTNFMGWKKAAIKEDQDEENDSEEKDSGNWATAQELKPDTRLKWHTLTADPHQTKAPLRYTEASLIKELEQKGIGRPSTFANLISTILDKEYVKVQNIDGQEMETVKLSLPKVGSWPPKETSAKKRMGAEKNKLVPTELGFAVLKYLLNHFEDLFMYSFTSEMEARLDKIAEGSEVWKQVLRDTWSTYKDRYTTLKAATTQTDTVKKDESRKKDFGDGLMAVYGKKGPLLLKESGGSGNGGANTIFYGWPDGISFLTITKEQALQFIEECKENEMHIGVLENMPIVRKSGKFGYYAEWNGKKVSCQLTDTLSSIIEKLQEKSTSHKRIGPFEIRKGPYGYYMFKYANATKKFVSIPSTVDLNTISEKDLAKIFQLQNKARSGKV